MSMPWCLTNPKLRMLQTAYGLVTVEIVPQGYAVFRAGQNLGLVERKGRAWAVNGVQYQTRKEAVESIVRPPKED